MTSQLSFHGHGRRRSPVAPILATIAAVLLIAGVIPRWWYATGGGGNEGGHADLGLVAAVDCEAASDPDDCMTIDYASVGDDSPESFRDFASWGERTYWLGIV